jgi:methionine salvage enolase-phosphatase E1
MDISTSLIPVDEDRMNELMQLCKLLYPDVADYFIHGICLEQLMYEQGYENAELAAELFQKAQEELKTTQYYVKVEENLSV